MYPAKIHRRGFIKQLGVAVAMAAVGLDLIPQAVMQAQGDDGAQTPSETRQRALIEPWYRTSFIGEPLMDERLIFYLGHTWYKMADIGECLDTCSRIPAGDIPAWRREWFYTADRVRAIAESSLASGHTTSAGEAYLRATSYYLAGLIYMESPGDPEMPRTARAVADCFEAALRLLHIPGEPVQIPYEGAVLPAYYYQSGEANAPLLIVHQGMDASIEESYFIAEGALVRGYNCLMFHHPGQGLALREHGFTFRPDWENVITPVVDFALTLPNIDQARIALKGMSFGGSLVLRAAAFEKRLKIVISNPPTYNWGGSIRNILFGQYPEMLNLLENDPNTFNQVIEQFIDSSPSYYRWWFNAARWKYGQETPADLLNHLQLYSLEGILQNVTCKVLLMDGTAEAWSPGDGELIHNLLPDSDYMLFTDQDTAAMHNQPGAFAVANQRMFDWLDDHL
jgi:pimeloyl-ACP methyl ester carboxylesterase